MGKKCKKTAEEIEAMRAKAAEYYKPAKVRNSIERQMNCFDPKCPECECKDARYCRRDILNNWVDDKWKWSRNRNPMQTSYQDNYRAFKASPPEIDIRVMGRIRNNGLGPDYTYHTHTTGVDAPEPIDMYYPRYKPGDCCPGKEPQPFTMQPARRQRSCSVDTIRSPMQQQMMSFRTTPIAPNYPTPTCPPKGGYAERYCPTQRARGGFCPEPLCMTRGQMRCESQRRVPRNCPKQDDDTQWAVTDWDRPLPPYLNPPKCEWPCVQRGQLKTGCPIAVPCPREPIDLARLPPIPCPPRRGPLDPPSYYNRYSFFTNAPVDQYQHCPPAQYPSVPCYSQRRDMLPQVFPFIHCSNPPCERKNCSDMSSLH